MLGLRALALPFPAAAAISMGPHANCLATRFSSPILHPPQLRLPPAATTRRGSLPGTCRARRSIRYGDDDDAEDAAEEGGDSYGQNADLAALETYTEGERGVALLVRAEVDGEEEEVLIFRGFSSLLTSGTFSDASRSVLPARAVIKTVDVVKGPFDPSDIQYLETGLTLEDVKARIG